MHSILLLVYTSVSLKFSFNLSFSSISYVFTLWTIWISCARLYLLWRYLCTTTAKTYKWIEYTTFYVAYQYYIYNVLYIQLLGVVCQMQCIRPLRISLDMEI